MKFSPLFACFAASLVLVPMLRAEDKPAAPKSAAKPLPVQAPDVPAVKYDKNTGEVSKTFLSKHESYVATAKEGQAQLLFLGDSITAGWATKGKEVWDKSFSAWQPANFGIGGDRTQHVLWRIQNGELDGLKPKAAVVMIGTNNSADDPADGIARGVTKIIETIRAKTPGTKILLLAVFPRGEKPSAPGAPNAGRDKLNEVNAILAKLADNQHVFYLDIGAKFLQPDGTITKEIMADFLHPTAAGYQIWADAITPKLTELMK